MAASLVFGRDGVEPGHGVPNEDEKGVADEGDLRGRIGRHVPGDGPENSKEGQRRDDVKPAGDSDHGNPQDSIAPRQEGQRQRDEQTDGQRQQAERYVLDQIGADLSPLARQIAPFEEGLCRHHARRLPVCGSTAPGCRIQVTP